ncbi:Arc family DNA-binding protein [Paraburkholderia sp. HD33-4]|uniref:Arc family DNA-binding protein n=1 Tax=Paraburkholderia sp. HD33-4 TaxID=2883242 RepID=UPI001F294F09|nr:Arc family DNA-binding protein [Paraburkholderia sp. HD33-4]
MDDTFRSQFRLPWPVYLQLKAAAAASGRSLNAELVAQLSNALSTPGDEAAPAKVAPLTTEQLSLVLGHIGLRNLLTPKEMDTVAKRLQALLASDK